MNDRTIQHFLTSITITDQNISRSPNVRNFASLASRDSIRNYNGFAPIRTNNSGSVDRNIPQLTSVESNVFESNSSNTGVSTNQNTMRRNITIINNDTNPDRIGNSTPNTTQILSLVARRHLQNMEDRISGIDASLQRQTQPSSRNDFDPSIDDFTLEMIVIKLETETSLEKLRGVLTDLNRFILFGGTGVFGRLSLKYIHSLIVKFLNNDEQKELWLCCIRVLRSSLDLNHNFVDDLVSFCLRLTIIIQKSSNIELLEECIGLIEAFVKVNSSKVHSKNLQRELIRLLDYVSVISQQTIIQINTAWINYLTPLKIKSLVPLVPFLIRQYNNNSNMELVQNITLFLHKLLKNYIHKNTKILKIFTINIIEQICEMYLCRYLSSNYLTLILQILSVLCSHFPFISIQIIKNFHFIQKLEKNISVNQEISRIEIEPSSITGCELFELVTLISNFFPPILFNSHFELYQSLIESYCSDITYLDLGSERMLKNYYIWEYFRDGKWERYPPNIINSIEISYQERQSPCVIRHEGICSILEFDSMRHSTSLRQTTGPIRRTIYYKTNDKINPNTDPRMQIISKENFENILYIISLVYQISLIDLNSNLSHKCLLILVKIIHYSPHDFVLSMVKSSKIIRMLGSYLKSSSLTVVTSAVVAVKILHEKMFYQIEEKFSEEGIYHHLFEINTHLYSTRIPDSCDDTRKANHEMPFKMQKHNDLAFLRNKLDSFINKTRGLFKLRRSSSCDLQTQMDSGLRRIASQRPLAKTPVNIHLPSIEHFLKNRIILIIDSLFDNLGKNVFLDFINNDCLRIAKFPFKIENFDFNEPFNDDFFQTLTLQFSEEKEKMLSPFKIAEIEIIEFMTKLLTETDDFFNNIKLFIKYFILGYENNPENSPFYRLVQMIQEYISHIEKLPTCYISHLSKISTDSHESLKNKIVFALTSTCVISFKRHPDCTDLIEIDLKNIELHPMKTISSIEKFIIDIIDKKMKEKSEPGSENSVKISQKNRRFATHSINDTSDSGNTPYYFDPKSSRKQYDLEILLNGVPLAKHLTLIQALITRYRMDPNKKDKVIFESCTLSNLYFGPSIVLYYRRSKIEDKNFNSKNYRFRDSTDHLAFKNMIEIKRNLFSVKNFLAFETNLYKSIKLLTFLHHVNFNWGLIINKNIWAPFCERKCFNNQIISLKANFLVSDPFISLLSIYPQWMMILLENCPFLYEFSVRRKLFQSLNYSLHRKIHDLIKHHPNIDLPLHITNNYDITKRDVQINRGNLYEDGVKMLDDTKLIKSQLSVTFEEESGVGHGPTAEFFSLLSKEIIKNETVNWNIWDSEYDIASKIDLYPSWDYENHKYDLKAIKLYFTMVGQVIGRCLLDQHQCDILFSDLFYINLFRTEVIAPLWTIRSIDPALYQSLVYILQCINEEDEKSILDMDLYYSWCDRTGNPVELCDGGLSRRVDLGNAKEYVESVLNYKFIQDMGALFQAIREGISYYVPEFIKRQLFFSEEYNMILSGDRFRNWTKDEIEKYMIVKPKYTKSSQIIQNFIRLLTEFTENEQRLFVMFLTSKPRLPSGGFSSLSPYMTIISCDNIHSGNEKTDNLQDLYLPSASTCIHTLKLPEYSSYEILRSKILFALHEGKEIFLLS